MCHRVLDASRGIIIQQRCVFSLMGAVDVCFFNGNKGDDVVVLRKSKGLVEHWHSYGINQERVQPPMEV